MAEQKMIATKEKPVRAFFARQTGKMKGFFSTPLVENPFTLGKRRRQEEILVKAREVADLLVKKDKERTSYCTYTDRIIGDTHYYDDVVMTGIAVSKKADYAVIILRMMMDYWEFPVGPDNVRGKELEYAVYKIDKEGGYVSFTRKRGMLDGDNYPEIKIVGATEAGIELKTYAGEKIVV